MNSEKLMQNKIFKLADGSELGVNEVEKLIQDTCHYVKYVVINQNDQNKNVAFIFPEKYLYNNPDYILTPNENDGCFCPRNLDELGRCLTGCMKKVNLKLQNDEDKFINAVIIGGENDIESEVEKYKEILNKTLGNVEANEEVYYIKNL